MDPRTKAPPDAGKRQGATDQRSERETRGAAVGSRLAHDAECPCSCHRADEVARDLLRELADREADIRRRLRRAQLDVAESADWTALSRTPTYAELRERRGETAA